MDWILGIASGVGSVGAIALGVCLFVQGRSARAESREDFERIIKLTKERDDLERDNEGYKRVVETRDEALKAKENELSKAREALKAATEALVVAHQKLSERGDASGVVSDLNDLLTRIRDWN